MTLVLLARLTPDALPVPWACRMILSPRLARVLRASAASRIALDRFARELGKFAFGLCFSPGHFAGLLLTRRQLPVAVFESVWHSPGPRSLPVCSQPYAGKGLS